MRNITHERIKSFARSATALRIKGFERNILQKKPCQFNLPGIADLSFTSFFQLMCMVEEVVDSICTMGEVGGARK